MAGVIQIICYRAQLWKWHHFFACKNQNFRKKKLVILELRYLKTNDDNHMIITINMSLIFIFMIVRSSLMNSKLSNSNSTIILLYLKTCSMLVNNMNIHSLVQPTRGIQQKGFITIQGLIQIQGMEVTLILHFSFLFFSPFMAYHFGSVSVWPSSLSSYSNVIYKRNNLMKVKLRCPIQIPKKSNPNLLRLTLFCFLSGSTLECSEF